MRRGLKWAGAGLGIVLLLVAALLAVAWAHSERALARKYAVADPPLVVAADAATIERGRHLYVSRGCTGCHGDAGEGKLLFDAGPVAKIVPPNLTRTVRDPAWTNDALAAAIRHGVRPDGRPLRFMPVGDFTNLSDADTAALVRHLQSLPPSTNVPGEFRVGPLGYVLYLAGKVHLVPADEIDHAPRARSAPPEGPTAAYGGYLAQVCTGCHGSGFAGQRVPGTPPEIPPAANLTPHADGLKAWSEADFFRALREGRRPDGSTLHPFMPWQTYGAMTDVELQAIWAHLRTLPPTPDR